MEGRLAVFRLGPETVGPYSQVRVSGRRWGTRDLRMRLLPRLEMGTAAEVDETRMYRAGQLLTQGDSAMYVVSGTDSSTGDYQRRMVSMRWHPVLYIGRVAVPELVAVEGVIAGNDEGLGALHAAFKNNAVRCRLPEGIGNGESLRRAKEHWQRTTELRCMA